MRWSTIERDLRTQHGPLIAGVDEVGRGPLAGPVVACAVVMPHDRRAMPGINDSKQLSAKKREQLAVRILANAVGIGIGAASVREIDRFNILQASVLAMRRALRRLPVAPNHVVVDGRALDFVLCVTDWGRAPRTRLSTAPSGATPNCCMSSRRSSATATMVARHASMASRPRASLV